MLDLQIRILELLISLLDSKFVLKLEYQHLLRLENSVLTNLYSMPLFNFLGLEVIVVLSGGYFSLGFKFNNFSDDDHTCTQYNLYTIW